jgi:hypothetical protein
MRTQLLLKSGANVHVRDKYGTTPYELAIRDSQIMWLFPEHNLDPSRTRGSSGQRGKPRLKVSIPMSHIHPPPRPVLIFAADKPMAIEAAKAAQSS